MYLQNLSKTKMRESFTDVIDQIVSKRNVKKAKQTNEQPNKHVTGCGLKHYDRHTLACQFY